MNTKKLIVFLLFAFLPMVVVGVVMHLTGAKPAAATTDLADIDLVASLNATLFSAGAMLIPLLAVVFTQLIFKEPVLKGVGISFKFNRWWVIGWVLMPVIALAVIGATLLMPGAYWSTDGEATRMTLQAMPEGFGIWTFLVLSLVSGLIAGATLNAIFAFGEEVAWRGFLMKEFAGKKFLAAALWIGVIWGLWHAPIILNGHNYPQHPVVGVFMMVAFCVLMTPMLMYFRKKSGSVLVPSIMHGTFNAVASVSALVILPENDLLYGAAGLAGFLVLLVTDVCLYLYDRFVSREKVFCQVI